MHLRTMNVWRVASHAIAYFALAMDSATTLAQDPEASYPDRPIKLIVPSPHGDFTDPVVRLLATDLSMHLGQPVVVDNRPGAAGSIGTEAVARAVPDGYTLLLHTSIDIARWRTVIERAGIVIE